MVNNIVGILFENMVGHIHSINSHMLELGREIIEINSRYEMDIYAIYSLQRLENFSNTAQKFKVSYFQAVDMKVKAKQMDNKKLKEALENFFLKIDV